MIGSIIMINSTTWQMVKQMASALPIERFERPKGSASMQRPKTSLANRAGSANARNRQIQVIPKEALESVKNNRLPKVVVIGSGAAGLVCVDTLREFGFYAGKLNGLVQNPVANFSRDWKLATDHFWRKKGKCSKSSR